MPFDSVHLVHGKTMIARRIPSILPDLTFEEALEITKIHSIAGILKQDTPIISRWRENTKTRRNKFSTLWSIIFR